jgi:murein DD-endopeptidase MepM/ murein hydrolase activator NlpD
LLSKLSFFLFNFFVLASLTVSCASAEKKITVETADNASLLSPSSPEKRPSGMPPRTLSFLWPIDGKPRIASFFGWRKKGVSRKAGERMHEGIDIGGTKGQKIYASADGRVIDVAFVKGYGRTVLIYHGAGWTTLYAHLSKYKVRKSQDVNSGDVVGFMGRSGRAQAVHLHFEIRKGADPLDPLLFLPSRELEKYAPKNFYNGDEGQ